MRCFEFGCAHDKEMSVVSKSEILNLINRETEFFFAINGYRFIQENAFLP